MAVGALWLAQQRGDAQSSSETPTHSASNPTLAQSDDSSLDSVFAQAKRLSRTGSLQSAESLLRSAIAKLQDPAGLSAIRLWNEQGQVHESESLLNEAEQDYQRAVRLNENRNPVNLSELAVSLNDLGTIAERLLNFSDAEAYFRRSLSTLDKGGLRSDPITGSVLINLATAIQKQGRFDEPAALFDSGLKLLQHSYGENNPEYAKALANFGVFEYQKGSYEKALQLQEKAYKLESALPFIDDWDKAFAMNNLALTLMDVGNPAEAEPLFRAALALEKSSAAPPSDVAQTINNLAILELRAGRPREARKDETEALRIAIKGLAPNDPMIALIWNNLGRMAASQGRIDEAKELYSKAANVWLTTGNANASYAATLSNLAALEARQNHRKQAGALYSQALEIDEKALGSSHPTVANDLSNIAIQLCLERKPNDAVEMFQRAVQIEEKAFGPASLEVARTLRHLAIAYQRANHLNQADQTFKEAITIFRGNQNETSELMTWLTEYAGILSREQKFAEAEQAFVQANGIRVRNAIAQNKD